MAGRTLNGEITGVLMMRSGKMNNLEDEVSYTAICEHFPKSSVYFSTYEDAFEYAQDNQPAYRPWYIVKCIKHFEICGTIE